MTRIPSSAASAPDRFPDPHVAVRAAGLGKDYRNPWTLKTARGLDGLDLEVARGEVLGLLGPNGAGKTTTLKLLTGLLKPTRGRAWLFGVPIQQPESRRPLGFLPEQPYFYDYLSGFEYLEFAGRMSGLRGAEVRARAASWLDRVGLGERPKLTLRKYSKGMLQRLGLAAALLHDPELLILDEPMSGLDPFGRRDVRELILEQRDRGAAVVFSSHILPDVEMVCDRVAIIHESRLVRTASVEELMGGRQSVEIRVVGAPLVEFPLQWQGLVERRERPDGTSLTLGDAGLLDQVLQFLLARGVKVRAVTPQRSSLEDLFLAATEHAPPASEAGRSRRANRRSVFARRQA